MRIPVSSVEHFSAIQRLLQGTNIVYGGTYNPWPFIQKGHAPIWWQQNDLCLLFSVQSVTLVSTIRSVWHVLLCAVPVAGFALCHCLASGQTWMMLCHKSWFSVLSISECHSISIYISIVYRHSSCNCLPDSGRLFRLLYTKGLSVLRVLSSTLSPLWLLCGRKIM